VPSLDDIYRAALERPIVKPKGLKRKVRRSERPTDVGGTRP
jgi:hypothetical protein